MKLLIDQLFVEWDDLQTPEELEIMKKYAEKGRRYSLGYSCKNASYANVFILAFISASFVDEITT